MKEILNAAVDLFPNCSFEVSSIENKRTLRIKLKKITLESEEIDTLIKIHPFRIHLAPYNDPDGCKLNLFFDFLS